MSLTFIINYYYYLVTFLSPFLFFPSNPPPQFQYIQVFFIHSSRCKFAELITLLDFLEYSYYTYMLIIEDHSVFLFGQNQAVFSNITPYCQRHDSPLPVSEPEPEPESSSPPEPDDPMPDPDDPMPEPDSVPEPETENDISIPEEVNP